MDFDRYVGIPWVSHACGIEACNCWGLIRLIFRELRGIELPSYSDRYASEEDVDEVAALIAGERSAWTDVQVGEEMTFDVAILRTRGRSVSSHVGLIVSPGLVLHVSRDQASRIERYRGIALGQRADGFFRYRE